jgi:predicted metal-dependent hydrolase
VSDGAAEVPVAVGRGVRLFNRGRYFSAQQVWETAWREAPAEDRGFLEGLVQLASGLHLRTRRGATRGAVHLLSQALVTLEDYRPATHGVDVEVLVGEFEAYLNWIRELGRPHRLLDRLRIPRLRSP